MKKILMILITLSASVAAFDQQPQTQIAPSFPVNATWVDGVAPGYAPTAGSGFVLNLSAGTAYCSSYVIATYAGGTLTLAASATNYVYLDTSASCAPTSNTTGFTSVSIPIAKVVTGSSSITATCNSNGVTPGSGSSACVADDRTMFFAGSAGTFSAGGDLSGSSSSQTVVGIQGHSVPSPSSGYLHWSGSAFVFDTPSGGTSGIADVSITVGTTAIGANACSSASTSSMTGVMPTVSVSVTAWSITSNVATFTAPNSLASGQTLILSSFGTSTFFNSQQVTVLSTGLSSTQFEANFTHADGSATESGTASWTGAAFFATPNSDISGVTGWGSAGGLDIVAWPTVNTLNYKVCNPTGASITPSASVTFNVGAR